MFNLSIMFNVSTGRHVWNPWVDERFHKPAEHMPAEANFESDHRRKRPNQAHLPRPYPWANRSGGSDRRFEAEPHWARPRRRQTRHSDCVILA